MAEEQRLEEVPFLLFQLWQHEDVWSWLSDDPFLFSIVVLIVPLLVAEHGLVRQIYRPMRVPLINVYNISKYLLFKFVLFMDNRNRNRNFYGNFTKDLGISALEFSYSFIIAYNMFVKTRRNIKPFK